MNPRAFYFQVSRQFFLMLALLQAWILGVLFLGATSLRGLGVI